MNCPRCNNKLGILKFPNLGDAEVHLCPGCEGSWYSRSSLVAFMARSERADVESTELAPTLVGDRLDNIDLEAPVHCPECNQEMSRFSYALAPNVELDECPAHGIWLDDGELGIVFDQVFFRNETLKEKRLQLTAERPEADGRPIAKGAINPYGLTLRVLKSLSSSK